MTGLSDLTIVTPSRWLEGLVKQSYLSKYPVRVIHNGIDTDKFCHIDSDIKQRYGIADKKMLLVVSTVWDETKGYSDYLKLADMLGNEYKIVMVGLTQEQLKSLPSNVLGIARTNSVEELAEFYSAADIFLNLSYCENYPTVNLEAVSCGTPVLTYDVGGSPESAFEGVTVPRGDLEAVKDKVCNFEGKAPKIDPMQIDKRTAVQSYVGLIEG